MSIVSILLIHLIGLLLAYLLCFFNKNLQKTLHVSFTELSNIQIVKGVFLGWAFGYVFFVLAILFSLFSAVEEFFTSFINFVRET